MCINSSTSCDPKVFKFLFQKSWDVALGPMKQIPMNLFIMWMAGNTISIFPIMMVGMMFIRPIQAFLSIQQSKLYNQNAFHAFVLEPDVMYQ